MLLSTISSRYQTTIPKDILSYLEAGPGDKLTYEINGESIIIKKQPSLVSLAGILYRKENKNFDLDKAISKARNEWSSLASKEGRA